MKNKMEKVLRPSCPLPEFKNCEKKVVLLEKLQFLKSIKSEGYVN